MYITRAVADGYLDDPVWDALSNDQKEEHITSASNRLDRLSFKADTSATSYPRHSTSPSGKSATGRLAFIVARLAQAYAVEEVRVEGLGLRDLPTKGKNVEIGPIKEGTKETYSSIVLDGPDLPLEIQSMLAPFCSHVNPLFRASISKPLKYLGPDDD